MGTAAPFALRLPLTADQSELPPQLAQPVVDGPAVDLELFFTFSSCGHGTGGAALPVLGFPQPDQTGLEILQFGQFDLQLGLSGACPPLEDLQDQARSVHDGNAQDLLQVAQLGGREGVVEDDTPGFQLIHQIGDLGRFSLAHVKRLVHAGQLLGDKTDRLHVAGLCKFRQLIHGVVKCLLGNSFPLRRPPDAGQNDRFLFVP